MHVEILHGSSILSDVLDLLGVSGLLRRNHFWDIATRVAIPATGIAKAKALCNPFIYASSMPTRFAAVKDFWTSVAPTAMTVKGLSSGFV